MAKTSVSPQQQNGSETVDARVREFAMAIEIADRNFAVDTHRSSGPLEALHGASDRCQRRTAQAVAMLDLLGTEEVLDAFDTHNNDIRQSYLAVIGDLVAAARVDAEIAERVARVQTSKEGSHA